jgi:rare lipoprotein A
MQPPFFSGLKPRRSRFSSVIIAVVVTASACANSPSPRPNLPSGSTHAEAASAADLDFARSASGPATTKADESGIATWYGAAFAGKKTASGERFDPNAMTAAHKTLPFGTWVEVRRVDTGRSVRVRVNDRGPWGDRAKIVDVSRAAAEILGLIEVGLTRVELRVVRGP